MTKFTLNNGSSNPGLPGFNDNTNQKLPVVNWLADLPETQRETDLVEVQFKNTRKGYYINNTKIPLSKGDKIAVEASPGHDIGVVSLTGRLVPKQMAKNRINLERYETRNIYRIARDTDLEKYEHAKSLEHATMIKARKIAEDLHLSMKIGDVEYQGDGSKAIFYYIADERVDFRQLIKVFAQIFGVRIEMKQIGARQEAGRIGGIGPCGRELCCATWMTNFSSVTTNSARFQDLSTNPLKLAGQCAKIKCCVNFEMGMYQDLKKDFPSRSIQLETKDATYYQFKSDIFKREITLSSDPRMPANLTTLPLERVLQIIAMNKRGEKPEMLNDKQFVASVEVDFQNVVGQDDLTRFDKEKRPQNKKRRDNSKRKERSPRNDRGERRNKTERSERRNSGDKGRNNKERGQRKEQNSKSNEKAPRSPYANREGEEKLGKRPKNSTPRPAKKRAPRQEQKPAQKPAQKAEQKPKGQNPTTPKPITPSHIQEFKPE